MKEAPTTTPHAERLMKACSDLNIEIHPSQVDTLLRYLDQLSLWNKTYNLTAVRTIEAMLVQHIFDSLSVIKPLDAFLTQFRPTDRTILDVGSGAGLPGVVIAAMLPNTRVTCVDTVEKKTSFIRQMAGVLALPNLTAVHARIEQLAPLHVTLVISRAFASIADFIALAGKHVSNEGALVAMKGQYPSEELTSIETNSDWMFTKADTLNIPELNAHRCMIWIHRNKQS